jgi:hypothetical protein
MDDQVHAPVVHAELDGDGFVALKAAPVDSLAVFKAVICTAVSPGSRGHNQPQRQVGLVELDLLDHGRRKHVYRGFSSHGARR